MVLMAPMGPRMKRKADGHPLDIQASSECESVGSDKAASSSTLAPCASAFLRLRERQQQRMAIATRRTGRTHEATMTRISQDFIPLCALHEEGGPAGLPAVVVSVMPGARYACGLPQHG